LPPFDLFFVAAGLAASVHILLHRREGRNSEKFAGVAHSLVFNRKTGLRLVTPPE
jgi:hypothetical protein